MNRFRAFYYRRIKTLFLSRPLFTTTSASPFFILSAGRSGSTLLRKLLLQSTFVNIPPESNDLLPKLIKFYLQYNHKSWEYIVRESVTLYNEEASTVYWNAPLDEADLKSILALPLEAQNLHAIVDYIFNHYAQVHGFPQGTWGEKTPFLTLRLPWLNVLYPSAKFIFLVRDGRAVVNSLMRMKSEHTVQSASERWLQAVRAIKKQEKKLHSNQYIYVRYEDLVASPELALKRICTFLKLPARQHYLEEVFMGDDVLPHHNNIKLKTSTAFSQKWQTELTPKEIRQATEAMSEGLNVLGYV